jgi:hypothetical protein
MKNPADFVIPPVEFAVTYSIESDRALIKPSNLPMAMRKKGKGFHADYDNFLLGCDFSSL